uniref:Uncharacterized protein n=1 Tax=Xiphophorus maculatus TaxID=8083 RepID=A0A3B5PXT3_XIPMA
HREPLSAPFSTSINWLTPPRLTLQDLHGQDDPGVLQVGDVQVARRVAGQADVQNPEGDGQTDGSTVTHWFTPITSCSSFLIFDLNLGLKNSNSRTV